MHSTGFRCQPSIATIGLRNIEKVSEFSNSVEYKRYRQDQRLELMSNFGIDLMAPGRASHIWMDDVEALPLVEKVGKLQCLESRRSLGRFFARQCLLKNSYAGRAIVEGHLILKNDFYYLSLCTP